MNECRMSLKICTTLNKVTHQTRPMADSKRSQKISEGFKMPENLGAKHQPTNHAGVGAQSAYSTACACVSACVERGLW
eukprot:5925589-Pyramimonas_sp.AAC.1